MVSAFTFSSLFIVIVWVYLTVSGQKQEQKHTAIDSVIVGQVNEMKKENILKENGSVHILPKSRKRRSLPSSRPRREVSSLVAELRATTNKLNNLSSGVEFLVQSTKEQLIGYTAVTKRLEAINTGLLDRLEKLDSRLINRLEQMNPFFVSMFVMLTDVALSTSPRIDKYKETAIDIANYFGENITTQTAQVMFVNNMNSVFKWYVNNATSCVDIRDVGFRNNGVFPLRIKNTERWLNVYCDQETDDGGWLVFQRRQDGSEDFYRDWVDYKNGFGQITSEFWLGNDYLHLLTKDDQELRVDLMDFDGNTVYAKYETFSIGVESENYKLSVAGYSGTAGDSLTYHNEQGFSTTDRDYDARFNSCVAHFTKGPWWHKDCCRSNLNGIYHHSAIIDAESPSWFDWKNRWESLKKVEMKIRPKK